MDLMGEESNMRQQFVRQRWSVQGEELVLMPNPKLCDLYVCEARYPDSGNLETNKTFMYLQHNQLSFGPWAGLTFPTILIILTDQNEFPDWPKWLAQSTSWLSPKYGKAFTR